MIDPQRVHDEMSRRVAGHIKPPFRGGAVDNLERAPMLKGHGNDGRPFDPETACYTKPIFKEYDDAVRNRRRLKLVLKAGVKTVKSFTGEVCAADHVCNRKGDAAIFFGTEATAKTGSTTRILDFFRGNDALGGGIPRFKRKLQTITNRFDETIGELKFPDKTLFILAANLPNCQQKNLAFVMLQDAFLTGTTGMIKEMMARTTQYAREAIIFIESQGGESHFDFDAEYDDTDQRELHVACPLCGSAHAFNWRAFDEDAMTRPDDFVPTPPLIVPSLDHAAWIAHHRPILLSKDRRVAGFKRGPDERIKLPSGDYDDAAVIRETHFECFHCGGAWVDDGEDGPTRVALDRSSHYVATRKHALPSDVGFNVPQWINRRLPWGPMMLEKLKAHKTASDSANYMALKIWWQKVAARTWSRAAVAQRDAAMVTGSYETDPEKRTLPDGSLEQGRNCIIDCQKALEAGPEEDRMGSFWVIIEAVNKRGDSYDLARCFCRSRAEVVALIKKWKVPAGRVCIDGRKWTRDVLQWAGEQFEWVTTSPELRKLYPVGDKFRQCWRVFLGDDTPHYRHGKVLKPYSVGHPHQVVVNDDGKNVSVMVYTYLWSNLSVSDQLHDIMLGGDGKPKINTLDRGRLDAQTQEMETGDRTYERQMNAEYRTQKRGKDYWEKKRPDNHYLDCRKMGLVRKMMDGLLGSAAEGTASVAAIPTATEDGK